MTTSDLSSEAPAGGAPGWSAIGGNMFPFLFQLLILVLVLGIFYYVIDTSPLDGTLKWVFKAVLLVVAALWLLSVSGLMSGEPLRFPR